MEPTTTTGRTGREEDENWGSDKKGVREDQKF